TDLKIPEIGPAIGYKVNDYLSIGFGARIVAGQFRFKQAIGTDSTIMKGTGRFSLTHELGDTAPQSIKDAGFANYGGVLSGKFRDASLGGVQFGYPELQGIGRLENAYAFGFGWDGGVQYRPYGSNKLVLSVSYRSRSVMDFKGGSLMLDFSDQFRKFYYDTAQFAPFEDVSFGAYLPGGATKFRGPRFFDALLGTIDNAATEDPSPKRRALAKAAMNWFLHGKNKDGSDHVTLDGNGYVRSLNLTAYYDPYMQFALPRELTFGAAWRPTERLLLSCEYKLIYMNDMVGDYFTFNLRSGDSPFFNWMILSKDQIERGDDSFDFSMHTDFNTIRSISLGAEYDLGNKWTIRGGVQHSNNTFTAKHVPLTFNMQPEDVVSGGFSYRLTDNWELSFAGTTSFTWDTTESKGQEKTGPNSFDPNFANNAVFHKGSEIDQFHSNAAFDHKQWQVNFGVAYLW
ncbi:MAG: hypothetical protein GXP58_10805, partial [Deltaproteobacteria bacterium]|nr:hypothetical protein [Deltaproteobacteria bacterium]